MYIMYSGAHLAHGAKNVVVSISGLVCAAGRWSHLRTLRVDNISQQIPTCLTLAILRPQLTTPLVRSRLTHSSKMRMTCPTAPSCGLYPYRVQNLIFPWSYAARLRSVARPGSARQVCGGDSVRAVVPRRSGGCDGRPCSRVTIFRVRKTTRCWRGLRTAARRPRM